MFNRRIKKHFLNYPIWIQHSKGNIVLVPVQLKTETASARIFKCALQ